MTTPPHTSSTGARRRGWKQSGGRSVVLGRAELARGVLRALLALSLLRQPLVHGVATCWLALPGLAE